MLVDPDAGHDPGHVEPGTPDVQRQVEEARAAGILVVTITETLPPAGASFQDWQTGQLRNLVAALHQATGR